MIALHDLATRAKGIGGSDAAAILGISPWRDRYDVWREKTGDPTWTPKHITPEMRWGQLLEPALAEYYLFERPNMAMNRPGDKWYWAPDRIRFAHLDGIVFPNPKPPQDADPAEEGIWEAKVPFNTWRYWDDGPPVYVLAQVQHYLDITRESWCDVSALLPGADFQTWRVEADPVTQTAIRTALLRFWEENVVPRVPPEQTNTRIILPRSKGTDLLEADGEATALVAALELAMANEGQSSERVAELKEALKGKIDLAPGMQGDGWRIRYKTNKDSEKIAWEEYAMALRALVDRMKPYVEDMATGPARSDPAIGQELNLLAGVDPDAILGLYTRVVPGQRPFVFTRDKENS